MGFIRNILHSPNRRNHQETSDEENGLIMNRHHSTDSPEDMDASEEHSNSASSYATMDEIEPPQVMMERIGEMETFPQTKRRQEQYVMNSPRGSDSNVFLDQVQENMEEFKDDLKDLVIGTSRGPKRDQSYDQSNHIFVLLRMYGSVWPKVLPFCIVNALWTLLIFVLHEWNICDLTLHSNAAHTFMSTLVSFLVVSRSNITYARFMESRQHLEDMFRSCRELLELASTVTMYDQCDGAKKWRRHLAYHIIVLLRTTIGVVDYQSSDDALENGNEIDHTTSSRTPTHHGGGGLDLTEWYHGDRSMVDENFRAPTIMANKLRETIVKARKDIYLSEKLNTGQEMALLGKVDSFLKAFGGIKKLTTTPFPFPLVQMTRWFLFAWIFSIPMTLIESMEYISETMIVVFFITYGFLGIEYVSIELDDPYGDDPSDFDNWGMAEIVFEDLYLTIFKTDGRRSASQLRHRVVKHVGQGKPLDIYRKEICKPEFWTKEE